MSNNISFGENIVNETQKTNNIEDNNINEIIISNVEYVKNIKQINTKIKSISDMVNKLYKNKQTTELYNISIYLEHIIGECDKCKQ